MNQLSGCGGVVVSALDFRSEVRWYLGRRVVSLDKKLCLVMDKRKTFIWTALHTAFHVSYTPSIPHAGC